MTQAMQDVYTCSTSVMAKTNELTVESGMGADGSDRMFEQPPCGKPVDFRRCFADAPYKETEMISISARIYFTSTTGMRLMKNFPQTNVIPVWISCDERKWLLLLQRGWDMPWWHFRNSWTDNFF